MAAYRRWYIPGGSYFFTVVTENRARILCEPRAREILRTVIIQCEQQWPFKIDAIVLLPDHLHTIWTLPEKDANYSRRWAWTKKEFTKVWVRAAGIEQEISDARKQRRRRGVWQPRFWEHFIRDEDDYERHMDYIHYNPVKHKLAQCPKDWPWSSFHRWVKHGVYDTDWGCMRKGPLHFNDLNETAME